MINQALLEKFGRVYDEGDVVFCEHEEGNECFVIHQGEVTIVKFSEGVEKTLAVLKPGDIFGEMGVLEDKPRTATALAANHLTVLALDLQGLKALVTAHPDFAFKLGRILGFRIVESYHHLFNLSIESPKVRVVDILLWKMRSDSADAVPYTPLAPGDIAEFAGLPLAEVETVLNELAALGRLKIYAEKIELSDLRSLRRIHRPA